MKNQRNDFLIHGNFVTMILISFVLLLRNDVYPYECMAGWERFNETSLADNLRQHHDLYVQRDTLLLADVSENFRNI